MALKYGERSSTTTGVLAGLAEGGTGGAAGDSTGDAATPTTSSNVPPTTAPIPTTSPLTTTQSSSTTFPTTTPSTTTPSSSTSFSSSPSSTHAASGDKTSTPTSAPGLQTGPVIGIAVGAVVVGLIVGLLIGLCIMARRGRSKKSKQGPGSFRAGAEGYESKHGGTAVAVAPVPSANALDVADFLLAAKPDRELASELQDLDTLIQQHVQTYYHAQPLSRDNGALSQALAGLGIGAITGADENRVVALALDPRTRTGALRHVISAAIFGSFKADASTRISLLPASVAEFAREVPPLERYSGNSDAMAQAQTRWRQLSAYLLNRNRSERGALSPKDFAPHVTKQARQLATALGAFLGVFAAQGQNAMQESHLQRVAVECAKLGYALFSQPDELQFTWAAGGGRAAAHPGLQQVADERGRKLKTPRTIVPPAEESD